MTTKYVKSNKVIGVKFFSVECLTQTGQSSNVGLIDSLHQLISGQTKIPVYLTHTLDDLKLHNCTEHISCSGPFEWLK